MEDRPTALDEHRLRRLIEAGRGLVAELDLEAVLERLLEVAGEVTGARFVALGILGPSRQELERFLTRGVDEATHRAIGTPPRGRGVLGLLIEDPRPLRLADVSDHPRSFGFPPGHPPMTSFLGVPILIRGQAWGNLYLSEKQAGDFDEADQEAAVILAAWAAIAVENARLYQGIERQRDELERAVRGLEATTAIARVVGAETRLEPVLELIAKRARALVEARTLVLLLENDGELVVAASAGEGAADLIGTRLSAEETVCGRVLRARRPERLSDLSIDLRPSLGVLGIEATSALVVPLLYRGHASGVLAAFDRHGARPHFDEDDEHLALAFAASAATAVATAQSVEEERLRVAIESSEQERRRWARELHDETLQGLGGLRMLLSSALRSGGPAEIVAAVEDAVEQLATEIDNLRTLITELRPAALDELGLGPALESLLDRYHRIEGLAVESRFELPGRLVPELESTVYRVIQEAVTNVAKHARAETVRVSVVALDGSVEVAVQDDGRGMDPEARPGGFGLQGMRERIALAGGVLEISSRPGETIVRARVPATFADADAPEAAA